MTMRVLHLTTHLNIGGITTYIERLITPLKPLGIQSFVLSSGGERSKAMEQKGAIVFTLPIRTKSELDPKLWLSLPALIKFVRENRIDLMHAHTRVTQVLASAASHFTGVPLVTTCHGFYKRRLGRRLFPSWGDRVIGISQTVGDHLIKDFLVPEDRVKIVYNAVNLEELDDAYRTHDAAKAKADLGFKPEDKIVGIVARIVEDKGHEFLIRALYRLQNEFPNLRLLIVGEGRCRIQYEKLAAELNIDSKVVFCGNKSDITYPLAAMDVFALPATWREGFGLSIVEAMACGKPTIVTDIWSLNTLIRDGVTGVLVEPKQIEPLARAIADLLKDPEKMSAMAKRARKMVEELFSITRMSREIQEIYSETAALGRREKALTPL